MFRLRWQVRRSAEPPRGAGTAYLLVAAFAVLALVTRLFCLDGNQSTAFWPANGAIVVAMLVLPWRHCLLVVLSCFVVNIAVNTLTQYTAFESNLYSTLNIATSYVVALQTRWSCGATTDLTRFRRLSRFGCIAFVSSALEAAIGKTIESGGGTIAAVLEDWLQWTMCDGLGFLLATPAILLSVKSFSNCDTRIVGSWERCSLLAAAAGLTTASFLFQNSPSILLIYPLLLLIAFRSGPPWVFAAILITAIISSGLTAHGFGPLAILSSSKTLPGQNMAQTFLFSIFLTAVPANNALGEQALSSRRLARLKANLEHIATHDGLTSLANRNLFMRRLGAMLQSGQQCAVLFIDLDRFKQVNDTMGHAAGDELLRIFSSRLVDIAGTGATVARFGGDEFAMVVPCDGADDKSEDICSQIAHAARVPFLLAKGPVHVSASIGLVISTGSAADASELMRKADIALYAVKGAGRDGYRIFSDAPDQLVLW